MTAPDICIELSVTEEVALVALQALDRDWPIGLTPYDVRIMVSAALRQIEADLEEEWALRPTAVRCAAEVAGRPCSRHVDVPWRVRENPILCWQHAKARAKAGAA